MTARVAGERQPTECRYAAYTWYHDHWRHDDKTYHDPPPELVSDAETLPELLAWTQQHYGRTVRRHIPPELTVLELFDWLDGSTVAAYRVG